MQAEVFYMYQDQFGYRFACPEHMLYPREIAILYKIRKNGRVDVKKVKNILDDFHKKNDIKSEFYYTTSRGKTYRVYPRSIYDTAIKEFKEEKENGI